MMDDRELLGVFVREGSEAAFGELMRRHVDLVYAAALRVVGGDAHLAKDVAQLVFIDLARKGKSIPAKVPLAGWLYRHTCFTASKAVRTERRRVNRESIATSMSVPENEKEAAWELVVPYLDAELNRLSEVDRDAVALRFFKQQSFQAVGAALGVSEDAAQMRVSRAVEKLREALRKRGVLLSTTALVSGLSAEAAVVAPVGWAAGVGAVSLAAAASGAGAKVGFVTFLNAMNMKGTVAVVGAALVGVATFVMQRAQVEKLREENRVLVGRSAEVEGLREENARLKNLPTNASRVAAVRIEPQSQPDQSGELLRLRAEVAALRKERKEVKAEGNSTPDDFTSVNQLSNVGYATPENCIRTLSWAAFSGDKSLYKQSIQWGETALGLARQNASAAGRAFDTNDLHFTISNPIGRVESFKILSLQSTGGGWVHVELEAITRNSFQEIRDTRSVQIVHFNGEWKWFCNSPGDVGAFPFIETKGGEEARQAN